MTALSALSLSWHQPNRPSTHASLLLAGGRLAHAIYCCHFQVGCWLCLQLQPLPAPDKPSLHVMLPPSVVTPLLCSPEEVFGQLTFTIRGSIFAYG